MANKHIRSDDEDELDRAVASTSAKRQRREDDEQSDADASPPPRNGGRGRGGAGDGDMDIDYQAQSDEEEDELDDDDDDEEQERRNLEEVERSMANNSRRVAEAGVIRQVDLLNFMCHAHTTVDFGPQVNFLVGVNGSGKSAVLTGITMALGGNAKATNRGQKGGDLVMEGATNNTARVSVTLANVGEDAFLHNIYGDEITIERTINKAGGGGYKIKNAEGKTVDTKKATLDKILDSFNIQVDNPMTVLTQDQSRQFLASASAKDKYTFFLRGTQLAQLTEEYEQIRSNTEAMDEALQNKRDRVPELKEAYRKAKDRAKSAQLAWDQKQSLEPLRNQLAWACVDEVEKQVQFGASKIDEQRSKLLDTERDIEKVETTLAELATGVADLQEAEAEASDKVKQHLPRIDELKQIIKANRDRTAKWKDAERTMNNTLARLQATIDQFDEQIAEEERKLSRDLEAERKPLRDNIARANDDIADLTQRIADARQRESNANEAGRAEGQRYEAIRERIGAAEQTEREHVNRIQHIKRSQSDAYAAYGDRMPRFMQAVAAESRWQKKPIGPIGLSVKLNKQEYSRVLESFFGPTLNAFIVTNPQDARLLKAMHKQHGLDHNVPILTQSYDHNFDFSHGEPGEGIMTVLRACTITDELVKQALIVSNRIETCALVPTRPDGDNLLRTNPRNVSAAYSADCFQIRSTQGRSSSSTMATWKGAPRLQRDLTEIIRRVEEERNRVHADIQQMLAERDQVRQRCTQLENERKQAEAEAHAAQRQTVQLNRRIQDWDAKLKEEQPNNIAALQENKRETEQERENMLAQYKAGLAKFEESSASQSAAQAVEEKQAIEEELKQHERILRKLRERIDKETTAEATARAHFDKLAGTRKGIQNTIEQYEQELEGVKKTRDERVEQATSICERPKVDKPKDRRRLEKEIDSIERALKQQAKEQGATLDEIVQDLEEKKKRAHEAVKSMNELAGLVKESILRSFHRLDKALAAAYDSRVMRWTDFRTHISNRARAMFQHHLTQRGFTGKLKFNHSNCTLDILIQTEADAGSKKAKQKDTKSLSGGEKSFSTICLLLTMWESVGCPLRCLDEFDVFMDAVNRRIAMKMMVDTAAQADQTQFILITPQDMGSLSSFGDEVKIVKLADPSRASGALARGR
ncbi:hypothetical protein JCM8115_003527 [Rhodotorula mucilaginosa]